MTGVRGSQAQMVWSLLDPGKQLRVSSSLESYGSVRCTVRMSCGSHGN